MKSRNFHVLSLLVILLLVVFTSCKNLKIDSKSLTKPEIFQNSNVDKTISYLEANISSQSNVFHNKEEGKEYTSIPGCVIAASEGMYASWPRDAAIVMGTITRLYGESVKEKNEKNIQKYGNYLINYVNWLKKTVPQEPADHAKFYIDGNKYEWMNQGDGPALRVITMSQMSDIFMKNPQTVITPEGKKINLDKDFVKNNFFGGGVKPEDNLITYEMDFINKNWNKKTFDIWEESNGYHFFTERVQLKAAICAAVLAKQLGDEKVVHEYLSMAVDLSNDLRTFYQEWFYYGIRHNLKKPLGGYLTYTENKLPSQTPFKGQPPENWYEKWERGSGINSSVMLGAIYADIIPELSSGSDTYKLLSGDTDYMELYNRYKDGRLELVLTSDKIIQTVYHYQNSFVEKGITPYSEGLDVYKVNTISMAKGQKGMLVGRYPGDNYNGIYWAKVDVDGNPWILTTCNLARYYYMLAENYKELGKISIPSVDSKTPDVIKFFRQATADMSLQANKTYSRGDAEFDVIINGLIATGNDIMNNLSQYISDDMRMSEQIDRNTGKSASYPNLTWSYSSFIDTYFEYKEAM